MKKQMHMYTRISPKNSFLVRILISFIPKSNLVPIPTVSSSCCLI